MTYVPFALHLAELLAGLAVLLLSHRIVNRRSQWQLRIAVASWWLVTLWPIGDIAASHSLSVATAQRLVIMLVVVPLIMRCVPVAAMERLTRPVALDAMASWLSRPFPALGVVTVGGTLTLSVPLVNAGASNEPARWVVLGATVLCGVILWLPVLGSVPGARHLSPAARSGYLFASSLLVTVMSFVWIFSLHPLYSGLTHQHAVIHLSALADQQIAGFVAKLGAFVPLWTVAFIIFFRADAEGVPVEESPLHWADVERHLLRSERRDARQARRSRR